MPVVATDAEDAMEVARQHAEEDDNVGYDYRELTKDDLDEYGSALPWGARDEKTVRDYIG